MPLGSFLIFFNINHEVFLISPKKPFNNLNIIAAAVFIFFVVGDRVDDVDFGGTWRNT